MAIGLGIETQWAIDQRRVVEMVHRFGGQVNYRHQRIANGFDARIAPWAPAWLRQFLGENYFVSVVDVSRVVCDKPSSCSTKPSTSPA